MHQVCFAGHILTLVTQVKIECPIAVCVLQIHRSRKLASSSCSRRRNCDFVCRHDCGVSLPALCSSPCELLISNIDRKRASKTSRQFRGSFFILSLELIIILSLSRCSVGALKEARLEHGNDVGSDSRRGDRLRNSVTKTLKSLSTAIPASRSSHEVPHSKRLLEEWHRICWRNFSVVVNVEKLVLFPR